MLNKENNSQKFGMERNLATKMLDLLPILYGKKGAAGVKLYQYFSWVDDVIDENRTMSLAQKSNFIERQINIIEGNSRHILYPEEKMFVELPWNIVPAKEVKHQSRILMSTIKDDLDHMPLLQRTERELRHYHYKTLLPIIEITSLLLNGQSVKLTKDFLKLIKFWERKDHVNHFQKDKEIGLIKLPLPPSEYSDFTKLDDVNDRKKKLEEIFSKEKLFSIQNNNLLGMKENLNSIWQTNLTLSQKVSLIGYLWFRIQSNSLKYSLKTLN